MTDWITWIIQVVAYGLIAFLLKREITQFDARDKRINERIDGVEKKIEAVEQKAADGLDVLATKLNETINALPFQYTLREDFIRSVAGFDSKLDKILDQLNRRQ